MPSKQPLVTGSGVQEEGQDLDEITWGVIRYADRSKDPLRPERGGGRAEESEKEWASSHSTALSPLLFLLELTGYKRQKPIMANGS